MQRRHDWKRRFPAISIALAIATLAAVAAPRSPRRQEQAPQQTIKGQPPQEQKPQQTIKAQTSLVNLFVTVRGDHNAVITNLTKDDFHIFEDNTEQKIAFFSSDVNMPITLGLMLDTSGSEQNMLLAIQDAGTAFMREVMRKGDEAMVLSFDTDVDLLADFTDDHSLIDNAIHRTRINAPSGSGPFGHMPTVGTAFYDGVYLAAHDQLAGQAGRKAIVVVTDANDEGSRVRVQEAIEAAQRADVVIHILLVADPRFGPGNGGVAHKMAEETGGRVIDVHSDKSLQQAFTTISEELRQQYVIGYYPTNTAHDGAFRKIRVETVKPGEKVLTRKGYYAPRE
jgi:VWFA-related protein